MPFDKDWTGFSAEEYREASESVMQEEQENTTEVMNRLNLAFSRMIYRDAHWNMKRSYRLAGKSFLEQNLVSFPISDALPIENGKMLDEAVSPTVAPRRAEASPSQNNPSSAVKADRGAV